MFEGIKWNAFLDEIANIESKGVYDIKGGSGNHYDGKYQLGKDAKIDAGRLLGIKLGHDEDSREAFRKNPELQEQAMRALVVSNHKALINKQGDAYTSLPESEQLAVLGYAHNQGAGGASKWMNTGVAEKDGFGTAGDKYAVAIRDSLTSLEKQTQEESDALGNPAGYGSIWDTLSNPTGETYTTTAGDNPYTVALNNGMAPEDFYALNPEHSSDLSRGVMPVGQEYKVGESWFEKLF